MHGLDKKKELALLLAKGLPLPRAAERCAVPYRTAARWAKDDHDFRVEVRVARAHHNVRVALDGTAYGALRGDRRPRPDALPDDGNIIRST